MNFYILIFLFRYCTKLTLGQRFGLRWASGKSEFDDLVNAMRSPDFFRLHREIISMVQQHGLGINMKKMP